MVRPCGKKDGTNEINKNNICQYWEVDVPVCSYWDSEKTVCKFFDNPQNVCDLVGDASCGFVEYNKECNSVTVTVRGEYVSVFVGISYPFCNLIGTDCACAQYDGSAVVGTTRECRLPNLRLGICNHATGLPWITPKSDPEYEANGLLKSPVEWTFDTITKYDDGRCNGAGDAIECSAYSPYHLAFGTLVPDGKGEDGTFIDQDRYCVVSSDLGYRLPLEFEMFNLRAKLSTCRNWDGDSHYYGITTDSGVAKVEWFDTKCTCSDNEDVGIYCTGGVVDNSFYYKCNGASSDCPKYTGICWEYCRDIKTAAGDKILAEQIHELRYNIRQEFWTKESYEKGFDDAEIYAWGGWQGAIPIDISNITLGSDKVYISSFKPFKVGYDKVTLTDGIPADDQAPNYYNLIREMNRSAIFDPIIKNVFEHGESDNSDYYETTYLYDDREFYIYGNTVNRGNTYIINLSDPEVRLVLPNELYEYTSSAEVFTELSFVKFCELQVKMDKVLTKLIYVSPEKFRQNINCTSDRSFVCSINTYFGENIVGAFSRSEGTWGFTIVKFKKLFVGGVVVQTNFEIKGDGLTYPYMPYYERTLLLETNDNGNICFEFKGIRHENFTPTVSYIYNDWDYDPPPCVNWECRNIDDVHYTGHIIYVEIIDIDVEYTNFQVLNSGHIIITVDNLGLTNAIMPWYPDKITLKNKCENTDGEGNTEEVTDETELEILIHGVSGMLLPNQIICYPKDNNDDDECVGSNTAPNKDSIISIEGIWNFHKRSFGETVDSENEVKRMVYENQAVDNVSKLEFTNTSGEIRKFKTTQIIGAAIVGRSGRVVATTQTKMLTWIKQPYCPDVEIKYEWKKTYDIFLNLPTCACHGKWSSIPVKSDPPYTEELTPFCGDHNIYTQFEWFDPWLGRPKRGPMWWPYNACRGFQTYTILNNQTYSALEIMSDFTKTDDYGNYIHGQHDLRMLGPSMCTAWNEYEWCLSSCECMKTYNAKGKSVNNSFIGYGQIRSGVSSTQLAKWRGAPKPEDVPKFGNASRPFLRSYRSSDTLHYYHSVNNGTYTDIRRRTKWLPAIMNFTDIDITSREASPFMQYDSPYKQCRTQDAFGFMLAGTIDSIEVEEHLSDDRLGYNDVFQTRGDNDISYPALNPDFLEDTLMLGPDDSPEPTAPAGVSMPWLEFKYYKGDLIQWAWRDYWKPVKRGHNRSFYDLIHGEDYNVQCFNDIFLCLVIGYSAYKYDRYLKESLNQPHEGIHTITFKPSVDPDEESLTFGSFQLDNGPEREFSFDGAWVSKDVYDNSTTYPWYHDMSLFTSDYFTPSSSGTLEYDDVPDEHRLLLGIDVKDGVIRKNARYYQRGLNVTLFPGLFWSLPRDFQEASISSTKITASDSSLNSVAFEIKCDVTSSIGKVNISYRFGKYTNITDETKTISYLHEPGIDIYMYRSGYGYYKVYNKPGMRLSGIDSAEYEVINKSCEFVLPSWSFTECIDTVFISLRGNPTIWECGYIGGMGVYDEQDNSIFLEDIRVYTFTFIEGTETIHTYERKYSVSVGKYGDMAPQGPDNSSATPLSDYKDGLRSSDTVYALGAIKDELSTVWQQDSRTGILDNLNRNDLVYGGSSVKTHNHKKIDIPDTSGSMSFVNKCRGRHVRDIVPELDPLYGDPKAMEKKQGEMFNSIYDYDKNTNDMSMSLIIHDSLKEHLNDNDMYVDVGGRCGFHNSYIAKLPTMLPIDTYSPAGHLYVQSRYYHSSCGDNNNDSWDYVFAQQESSESTKGMKEQLENEDVSLDFIDTIIGHDATLQYGINSKHGVGSIYVAEEDKEILGGTYLKSINEVTKYSLGTSLIQDRMVMMSYLVNSIYPYYYGRSTGFSVFVEIAFSSLAYPPVLQDYPFSYFPSDHSGYSENANIDRDMFYLYGGWNDHFCASEDAEALQIFLDLLGGRYQFGGN